MQWYDRMICIGTGILSFVVGQFFIHMTDNKWFKTLGGFFCTFSGCLFIIAAM